MPKGRAADAFFKAGLHHPDLAHVGGQLAAARDIANAGVEDVVNRLLQRGEAVLALAQALRPSRRAHRPTARRPAGSWRDGFAFADAAVGVLQGDAEQRSGRPAPPPRPAAGRCRGQAQLFELAMLAIGVAGLQQLEHFVKQAALRHVGQQLLRSDQRRGGFGVELEAQRR